MSYYDLEPMILSEGGLLDLITSDTLSNLRDELSEVPKDEYKEVVLEHTLLMYAHDSSMDMSEGPTPDSTIQHRSTSSNEEGEVHEETDPEDCKTISSFIDHIPVKELTRSRFDEEEIYQDLGSIGEGGNGKCFLLERRTDGALRACKVSSSHPKYCHKKPFEAWILQDVLPNHENIVRLHDYVVHSWKTQVYFEYCDGGDMHSTIEAYLDSGELVPEYNVWECFHQLAKRSPSFTLDMMQSHNNF